MLNSIKFVIKVTLNSIKIMYLFIKNQSTLCTEKYCFIQQLESFDSLWAKIAPRLHSCHKPNLHCYNQPGIIPEFI